jgi:TPR repeat protein
MLSISTDLESPASASLNMISFVDPMFGTVLNIFSSHPFHPSIAELEAITSLALLYDQGKVMLASTSDQLNHHQCRRLLEFAAGAGHVPAMHRFSMLLCHQQQSTVNTQNELLALLWLAKAAARGYRPAWSDLIDQLSPYFSNHLDQSLALKRRGSIDLAQPQSLGELKSSKLDLETVSMLLLNAMRGDESEALYQLALQLDRGNILMNFPSMPTAAFACFMQASIHGHLAALCNLGVCFDTGRGLYSSSNASSSGLITQSELAIECFREAASRGNVMAMKNLGVLHEQGRPPFIHRNHVHAMEWYGFVFATYSVHLVIPS